MKREKARTAVVLLFIVAVAVVVAAHMVFWGGVLWMQGNNDAGYPSPPVWIVAMVIALGSIAAFFVIVTVAIVRQEAPKRAEKRRLRGLERACRQNGHDWDGCVCRRCGQKRDAEHDWDGCVCRRCGQKRDAEHDWDGCVCRRCGQKRDTGHDWDGCTCRRCGQVRDEGHEWAETMCGKCGGDGIAFEDFDPWSYGKTTSHFTQKQYPCECSGRKVMACAICGSRRYGEP